jgi:hypothetical protein
VRCCCVWLIKPAYVKRTFVSGPPLSDVVMFLALFASYAVLVCAATDGPTSDELFDQVSVVIETWESGRSCFSSMRPTAGLGTPSSRFHPPLRRLLPPIRGLGSSAPPTEMLHPIHFHSEACKDRWNQERRRRHETQEKDQDHHEDHVFRRRCGRRVRHRAGVRG